VDFDALRAAVVPGAGVVGRWPGVICVAECADRQVMRQLLDVCAGAVGDEPGRSLARRLAGWLSGPDAPGDGLRFGTVAVTGADTRSGGARSEQWAVFLYGSVGLVVPDRQVALSGAQSVAWTDRLMPRPDAPVVLALEGGPIPPGVVDGVHDLRLGIVPGAGALLVPGGEGATGDAADESARNRPDDSRDSRWPDSGPDRPRWGAEPAAAPSEGRYPADEPGNGVPPGRGSLGAIDGGLGNTDGGEPERSSVSGSGRAYLRPVPSGSNGIAHHGRLSRHGSAIDDDRGDRVDRTAGRTFDHSEDGRSSDRDEPRAPEITSPGLGDDHAPDTGRLRKGINGSRPNGISFGLIGGGAEALSREPERSLWADGPDPGRPERIEGWFGTRDDVGTESDLSAVGPTELRRRRHARREDDTPADDDPAAEAGRDAADTDGAPPGDVGPPGGDRDSGGFGTSSVEDSRDGEPGTEAQRPSAPDGVDLDGSGEGTPRFGVPRALAAPEGPSEPEAGSDLQQATEPETHTTALRSELILALAPGDSERTPLGDEPATSGLAVDDRQGEQVPGYLCARGHLNDPRSQFCALCGMRIEEQSGPPANGTRPPLGLLVFDDGATYTVDAEYLMGRMPEADPRVTAGEVRSLALEDASGAVSRVHAQIIVDGWDALLVDAGSRNGTFVSPPGDQGWTQLPAGETHRLVPGTRVRIGGRSFQFESPSGER
jgi:hypothetical protein